MLRLRSAVFAPLLMLSLSFVLACSDDDGPGAATGDGGSTSDAAAAGDASPEGATPAADSGAPDGGSPDSGSPDSAAADDSGTSADGAAPGLDGATAADAASVDVAEGACPAKTAPLPATRVTIDAVTYYLVLQSLQPPTPPIHRVQLNFGTEAQFRKCPDEPGANSTLALTLTFQPKPTAGGAFKFTSNRGGLAADQVNFYLSFFNNTGHARMKKSYKSPDAGQLDVTIAGNLFSAPLAVVMANEAEPADTFMLTGMLSSLTW